MTNQTPSPFSGADDFDELFAAASGPAPAQDGGEAMPAAGLQPEQVAPEVQAAGASQEPELVEPAAEPVADVAPVAEPVADVAPVAEPVADVAPVAEPVAPMEPQPALAEPVVEVVPEAPAAEPTPVPVDEAPAAVPADEPAAGSETASPAEGQARPGYLDEVQDMFRRLEAQMEALAGGMIRIADRQTELEERTNRALELPPVSADHGASVAEQPAPPAQASAPPAQAEPVDPPSDIEAEAAAERLRAARDLAAAPLALPPVAEDEFASLFESIDEAVGTPAAEPAPSETSDGPAAEAWDVPVLAQEAPVAEPAQAEPWDAPAPAQEAPVAEPSQTEPWDVPAHAPAQEAPVAESVDAEPWDVPVPAAEPMEPAAPSGPSPEAWDAPAPIDEVPAAEPWGAPDEATAAPAAEPWDASPAAEAPAVEPWDVPAAAEAPDAPAAEPWDVPAPAPAPADMSTVAEPAEDEPWDAPAEESAMSAAEPWDAPAAAAPAEPWDEPASTPAAEAEPWAEPAADDPWGGAEDFSHMAPAEAGAPVGLDAIPVDLIWAIGEQDTEMEEVQRQQIALDSMRRQAREATTNRSRRGGVKPKKLPLSGLDRGQPLVIAVYSPKGGSGKSTTSVNLGAVIADSSRRMAARDKDGSEPLRVCVIDGDIGNGNLAIRVADRTEPNLLNLQEWMDAHEGHAPDEYDSPDERVATIRDFMLWTPELPNLNVLAAPSNAEAYNDFQVADYEHLLRELGRHFDVIIIDCGTEIVMDSTRTWLRHAHQVFLLTLPERAALHSAGKAARLIARPTDDRDILVTADKLNIVMMRSDADLGLDPEFGMQRTFPWADAQNTFYFRDFDLEAGQANNRGSFLALENQDYNDQIGALVQIALRKYRGTSQAAAR